MVSARAQYTLPLLKQRSARKHSATALISDALIVAARWIGLTAFWSNGMILNQ